MTKTEFTTLIIAVILSLFFWAYFRLSRGGVEETFVVSDVPVRVTQVAGIVPQVDGGSATVEVTVKGPVSALRKVGRDSIIARLQTDVLQVGETKRLPVIVEAKDLPGVTFTAQPSTVKVHAAPLRLQQFAVDVSFIASPPPGASVGDYIVSPTKVMVEGTDEVLGRVKYVTVSVDPNLPLTVPVTLVPQPVDADGERVEGTTVKDSTVSVAIASLTGEHATRQLAVRAPALSAGPVGLSVRVVAVKPDVVTVIGPTKALDRLGGYIETEPLDVGSVRKDITRTLHLKLPPGLAVVEGADVRVSLEVRPLN
jgi:YbbR domain-containing protein